MDKESGQKIEFTAFIGWGFQSLILAVGAWGVSELSLLSKSVQELNVKMAVTIERDIMRGDEIVVLRGQLETVRQRLNYIEARRP